MAHETNSKFISELAEAIGADKFARKILLAPTRRIGDMWLKRVAFSGTDVFNVVVETVPGLARNFYEQTALEEDLSFLDHWTRYVIVDQLFNRLQNREGKYIARLSPKRGLIESLAASIDALREAGVTAESIEDGSFVDPDKSAEFKELMFGYEKETGERSLIDQAELYRRCRRLLESGADAEIDAELIIMPADLRLSVGRRKFIEALPSSVVIRLDETSDDPSAGSEYTDAALLRFAVRPGQAPPPKHDRTATIYRAIGELNEIREIFRICRAEGLAYDDVEVIYSDPAAYIPLVYECALGLAATDKGDSGDTIAAGLNPPVTFAEGTPSIFFRPGRALTAWADWKIAGEPQSLLARMIEDGLLEINSDNEKFSFAGLAAELRTLAVGNGVGALKSLLEKKMTELIEKLANDNKADEESEASIRRKKRSLKNLEYLAGLVDRLIEADINPEGREDNIFSSINFLNNCARSVNRNDNYVLSRMITEIEGLRKCQSCEGPIESLNSLQWLAELPLRLNVGGAGDRPGKIFCTGIRGGGYSGRKNIFIVGLDDAHFPGAGRAEPLLLDSEKSKISSDIPTSALRLTERIEDIIALLSRIGEGKQTKVRLSYPCRDISDGHEKFPGPLLLSIHRILSGDQTADLESMLKSLAAPSSFAPSDNGNAITTGEWWISAVAHVCAEKALPQVEAHYQNIRDGRIAASARLSDRFTEYDGNVPEAADEVSPFLGDARPLSASGLELFARCPQEYFYRRILKIESPDEIEYDPKRWLDNSQKGELLHQLFRDFMKQAVVSGQVPPAVKRDGAALRKMLDRLIDQYRNEIPPPSEMAFMRMVDELRDCADFFIAGEASAAAVGKPLFFEASLGLPSPDEPTDLDTNKPIRIIVDAETGQTIKARGRIDRIDRAPGGEERYLLIDYKTGSASKYSEEDPYGGGRVLQNALYILLVEQRLAELKSAESIVDRFEYVFISRKNHGERIGLYRDRIEEGRKLIAAVCKLMAAGAFPFTDNPKDIGSWNEYREVFGGAGRIEELASAICLKTNSAAGEPLGLLANLREGRLGK